jgi:hypothetical protein
MKRVVKRTMIACSLILLFLCGWFESRSKAARIPRPAASCTVPKSWGAFRGAVMDKLIFEDSAGTIRLLGTDPMNPCMTLSRQ